MRISDWSSDVCSSDLLTRSAYLRAGEQSDFRIRNAADRYPRAAGPVRSGGFDRLGSDSRRTAQRRRAPRSEEHTSELQSLMRISYAVFCLKKKNIKTHITSMLNTNTFYNKLSIKRQNY